MRRGPAALATLPDAALLPLFAISTHGLQLALCLHRVVQCRRRDELLPYVSIPADELDELIRLVRLARGRTPLGLTVAFDDGYADACAYIRTRAPRNPDVEWLFFLCPEKTVLRAGYRWDAWELECPSAHPAEDVARRLTERYAPDEENYRKDLRRLGDHPSFRLATVEECRAIAGLPGVQLGNHTNSHQNAACLNERELMLDVSSSTRLFEALFGRQRHFAFPFGTPGVHVCDDQVRLVTRVTDAVQWSTEARPYRLEERGLGALLPRFPIDGTRRARELFADIALRALRFRVRGSALSAATPARRASASSLAAPRTPAAPAEPVP